MAFVLTPSVLGNLARHRAEAGRFRPAALYAFLACVFHPSSQMRFKSSFLAAQAVGSTDERIAAFQVLRSRGSSEQSRLLNFRISIEQDNWQSVLDKSGDPGDKPLAQKPFEIRALGELGRIDEMIASYAEMIAAYPSAQSAVPLNDLVSCRLIVTAFSGRLDAVRTLLGRFPRLLSSRDKAYWTFIATQASGIDDEEARRDLMAHAHAAKDEAFRRMALRHLNAAAAPSRTAVSVESLATIAAIEETLRKTDSTRHSAS